MHKQVSSWTVNFWIFVQILQKAPFWNFRPESPPPWQNFRFEMTKVYPRIPPPPMKNFRFEMTKVYSGMPPHPTPKWKTSDLRWPKFTLECPPLPPPNEKLQIWDDQSLLLNTPPNEKLQIWDDQGLLHNAPPPMKNFRFEITKVYSGIPPSQMKNFRFEMTKVYSGIPPPPPLKSGRSYVETNLYPPWIPLVIPLLETWEK